MNVFVSLMRTLVPMAAGWVLTVSGVLGVDLDDGTVVSGVTVILAGAYYVLFRVLEDFAHRARTPVLKTICGILLGWAKPPTYESAQDLEKVIQAVREPE